MTSRQQDTHNQAQTEAQEGVGTVARSVDTPRTMVSLAALCDRLEQLRGEATPGPWHVDLDAVNGADIVSNDDFCLVDGLGAMSKPDAALIAAAVNALPELIAKLRRQAAALHAVEALAEELVDLATNTEVGLGDRAHDLYWADQLGLAMGYRRSALRIRTVLAATAGQ